MKTTTIFSAFLALGSHVADGFPSPSHSITQEAASNILNSLKEMRSPLRQRTQKRQLFDSLSAPVDSISPAGYS